MKFFKRLFNFYVFSNIHVAIATLSLTKITLLIFGISENTLPFFVFSATLLSYNFIRLYRKSEIKSWLYSWIQANLKLLYIISVISLGLTVYFGINLHRNTLLTLIPLGVLTLFYTIPLPGSTSLRSLAGFKLFLIVSCWATVTVLLPVINYDIEISRQVIITFLQRLVVVAAITLPFDIRDADIDNMSLKTIPQVYGIARTKRIGIFLLMLFLGLNFFRVNPLQYLKIEFIIALVSLLLLVRSIPKQNKYYSAFFVEAVPIIWLGLLLMVKFY